ncbi:MAG TPA: methyltransferase domain-containing protein [Solirubrobacteraceae bacterium]|nr:methyltransferase domain-containing protein [Solirubrobacteraceae bacterium]
MTTASTYRLRGGVAGRERLRVLSRVMETMTSGLLERLDIRPGARCLDVGCGGGDVTLALARLAGPAGEAVGIDIDEVKLRLARDEAADAGVENVDYRAASVDELPQDGEFDLVYARFLLTHLADPGAALRSMIGASRPGAVVAVEDIDYAVGFCHPPCAAYDAFWDVYPRVAAHAGGDARIGRRLPVLFAEAGLRGISVHIEQPAGFDRDVKLLSALTLENIADAAVAAGLIEAEEIAAHVEELHRFAARPDTLLSLPRVVQVWARVPDAG